LPIKLFLSNKLDEFYDSQNLINDNFTSLWTQRIVATDLNNDGTASINQMTETQCYNNNVLTINSNNTFSVTSKGVKIANQQTTPTIECFTDPVITGTWASSNNTVTLTYVKSGVTVTQAYILVGNTLSYKKSKVEIVATTSNGTPVYLTSDIEVIYSK
jgi:hypothetical protein